MVYKIIVKPKAEEDFIKAIEYYNEKRENLGSTLFFEISSIIERIKENPELFQKKYKDFRISFTKKFKYGIHFTIEKESIFIHAVLHTSQKLPE